MKKTLGERMEETPSWHYLVNQYEHQKKVSEWLAMQLYESGIRVFGGSASEPIDGLAKFATKDQVLEAANKAVKDKT